MREAIEADSLAERASDVVADAEQILFDALFEQLVREITSDSDRRSGDAVTFILVGVDKSRGSDILETWEPARCPRGAIASPKRRREGSIRSPPGLMSVDGVEDK